jgi:hypothetical protein
LRALTSQVDARLTELQAKQLQATKAWQREDDERQVRSQYEAARTAEMVQQAEEGAAEVAVRKEMLATTLTMEDQLLRVRRGGLRRVGRAMEGRV